MSVRDTGRKSIAMTEEVIMCTRTQLSTYRQVIPDGDDQQLVLGFNQVAVRSRILTQLQRLHNHNFITNQVPLPYKHVRFNV